MDKEIQLNTKINDIDLKILNDANAEIERLIKARDVMIAMQQASKIQRESIISKIVISK